MTEPIKSMSLFFIDNQGGWPEEARLAGDLVLWPDDGKYPAATPVSMATHPGFDGKIIALAGERTLVLAFCEGAVTQADVRKQMSAKPGPEQYRIAIDALIHRVMMHRAADNITSDNAVHPFALLQWIRDAHPAEAAILRQALTRFMAKPEAVESRAHNGDTTLLNRDQVYEQCDTMAAQLAPKERP